MLEGLLLSIALMGFNPPPQYHEAVSKAAQATMIHVGISKFSRQVDTAIQAEATRQVVKTGMAREIAAAVYVGKVVRDRYINLKTPVKPLGASTYLTVSSADAKSTVSWSF